MAQDENYKQVNRDRALINANKKKASYNYYHYLFTYRLCEQETTVCKNIHTKKDL